MKLFVALCFMVLGANALPVTETSQGFVSEKGNVGLSGILRADGTTDLFSHELAHDILFFGPAGAITKSGRNIQFTADLGLATPRTKRSTLYVSRDAVIGDSGIVNTDGNNVQFLPGQVSEFVLRGPSGIVTANGNNIQFTRRRRSLSEINKDSIIGDSGVVQPNGRNIQFTPDQVGRFILKGPSGIVTDDGNNIQFTRKKRHLIGDSGMVLDDGTQIQFMTPGVGILLEGPSAILLTDGTQIQKN